MFKNIKELLKDEGGFAIAGAIIGELIPWMYLDGIGWVLTAFGIPSAIIFGIMGAFYDLAVCLQLLPICIQCLAAFMQSK